MSMLSDWIKKMAVEMEKGASVPALEGVLEAAGELKCLELKVMLGRCLEILEESLGQIDEFV